MKICPKCKKQYENGNFCEDCENEDGSAVKLEELLACAKCGRTYPVGTKFCSECGIKLGAPQKVQDENGITIGDRNNILGDVVGHKENYDITGNATIIHNEDETKKTAKCHICGSVVQRINGYDCPDCGEFTCEDCFNKTQGTCRNCVEKNIKNREQQYKTKVIEFLSNDNRIDAEEFKILTELSEKLGISSFRAMELQDEVRTKSIKSELTTFEKLNYEKAEQLFYEEGKITEALQLLESIYTQHDTEEKILELYLPVLAEVNPEKAKTVISSLNFDSLGAYLTQIDIAIREKDLSTAEQILMKVLSSWKNNYLAKCRQILYRLKLYDHFNSVEWIGKAEEVFAELGEPQNKLEKSWKYKLSELIDEANGKDCGEVSKAFCEENQIFFGFMKEHPFYTSSENKERKEKLVLEKKRLEEERIKKEKLEKERAEKFLIEKKKREEEEKIQRQKQLEKLAAEKRKQHIDSADEVTVGKDKDCDFSSIQEAIDSVKENCRIVVKNGTYREKLNVNKSVTIEGEDFLGVIISSARENVCTINAPCRLSGMTFMNEEESVPSDNPDKQKALIICRSDCSFDNCLISKSYGNGLIADGKYKITISNCTFMSISYRGICVMNGADLKITQTEITNTKWHAIVLIKSNAVLEDVSIKGITNDGIFVDASTISMKKGNISDTNWSVYGTAGSRIHISDYEMCKAKEHFVRIQNKSEAELENCILHDLEVYNGIYCIEGSKCNINSCEIYDVKGKGGVFADGQGTRVEINSSKIHDTNEYGILAWQKAEVKCTKSEIYSIKFHCVELQSYGSFQAIECKLYDCIQYANVYAKSCGNFNAEDTQIYNSRNNSLIFAENKETGVNLTRCSLYNAKSSGIVIQDNAYLQLWNSTVKDTQNYTVHIISGLCWINGCHLYHKRTVDGTEILCAVSGSKLECKDTEFAHGKFKAMDVMGSKLKMERCTLSDIEGNGMYLAYGTTAEIKDCEISSTADSSVLMEIEGTSASFENCSIHDAGNGIGIEVKDKASAPDISKINFGAGIKKKIKKPLFS